MSKYDKLRTSGISSQSSVYDEVRSARGIGGFEKPAPPPLSRPLGDSGPMFSTTGAMRNLQDTITPDPIRERLEASKLPVVRTDLDQYRTETQESRRGLPSFREIGQRIADDWRKIPETDLRPPEIQRLGDAAARALTPDSPMIGRREDGSYGNIPGPTARERLISQQTTESTGSQGLDRTLDFVGEMGSYLFNPAGGIGQGPIALYNSPGVQRLAQQASSRIRNPLGQRVAEEAAREGLAAAAYAGPRSLLVGDSEGGEIARNVAIEGSLGVAGGAAFPLVGAGVRKLLERYLPSTPPLALPAGRARGNLNRAETPEVIYDADTRPTGLPEASEETIQRTRNLEESRNDLAEIRDEINAIQSRYEQAVNDQYNLLREQLRTREGVEPRRPIYDSDGYPVGGVAGYSRNPQWYQDFYEMYEKVPNRRELYDLARQHIDEGYMDMSSRIPSWREMNRFDETLTALQSVAEEIESGIRGLSNRVSQVDAPLAETKLRRNEPFERISSRSDVQSMSDYSVDGRPLLRRGEGTGTTPIRRSEIIKELSEKLDIPIRVGRYQQRAHGIFKVKPEVVRTRLANDIPVISHEVGHALDKRFRILSGAIGDVAEELTKLGRRTSNPNYTPEQIKSEGVAEYVRMYLTDPEDALSAAPRFSEYFKNRLPNDVMKILDNAQRQIKDYIEQPLLMKSLSEMRVGTSRWEEFKESAERFLNPSRWYTQFVDELNPINNALKPLGEEGRNVFRDFWLLRGSAGRARSFLHHGVSDARYNKKGDSLKQILHPVMEDLDLLRTYAKDKRAIELAKRDIMTGSDINLDERIKVVQYIERTNPEVVKAHEKLKRYQDMLLDELTGSGVLSKDDVAKFKKDNQEYVPFYRVIDNNKSNQPSGIANASSPVKRIKGSDRDIEDILESIIKNTYHYTAIAQRNKAMLNLVDTFSKHDGLGKLVEKVPIPMQQQSFSLSELQKVFEEANIDVKDVDLDRIASIFRPSQQIPGRDNIVQVYRNGKRELYQLDQDLYRAVTAADTDQMGSILRAANMPVRWLRSGVVNTLEFWFKNMWRDQFHAMSASNYGYIPFVDMARGMAHVLGKTDTFRQYMAAGGAQSFRQSLDRKYLQEDLRNMLAVSMRDKTLNILRNPIQAMQALSELSETGTRVGEFARGARRDSSPEGLRQAALSARDLIDFGRAGSIGKNINRISAFWNAQIQGVDRTIRVFTGPNKYEALAKSTAVLTVPTIGLYQANKNDPRYQELSQWDKDLFWHFWVGDKHFRLPIPFELGVLFKVIPERILSAIDGVEDPTRKLGETIYEQFSPIPWINDITALSPWIEAYANKNFMDAPIVPRNEENLPAEDQAGSRTSSLAKAIARLPIVRENELTGDTLGSPRKIDHVISGYFGSLGQYASQTADAVLGAVGARETAPKPDVGLSSSPFFKGIMGRRLSSNTDSIEKFYERLDDLNKRSASARKREEDFEEEMDLRYMRSIQSDMRDLTVERRRIEDDKDMSPREKTERIQVLNWEINNLAREGLGLDPLRLDDLYPNAQ